MKSIYAIGVALAAMTPAEKIAELSSKLDSVRELPGVQVYEGQTQNYTIFYADYEPKGPSKNDKFKIKGPFMHMSFTGLNGVTKEQGNIWEISGKQATLIEPTDVGYGAALRKSKQLVAQASSELEKSLE